MVDAQSGESNLPYLRRHLKGSEFTVVTFAEWEQGLIVHRGSPKAVRSVADLARKDLRFINRESGSGARLLLDQKLAVAGIRADRVKGYRQVASSHLEVARLIAEGMADVGIGVRSAAWLFGLGFIPLQEERYDLVIPTPYLHSHPSMSAFLDTIVTRAFRAEIEALGGYDTKETGRIVDWKAPRAPHPS
jgi:molybdate-binding protein